MTAPRASRAHRWLLVVPFVWQLAAIPLVNRASPRPAGLPFPLVWQMAGVLVATLVLGLVRALDRRADARERT